MAGRDVESRGAAKDGRSYPYAAASTPYYYETTERGWKPWLIPLIVAANVAVFVVAMLVNNCPKNPPPLGKCVARFLGRFSFEPLRENPLFGPSSATLGSSAFVLLKSLGNLVSVFP
ncbi:hypothetical protein ACLOJK_005079 [Asimina triloba]